MKKTFTNPILAAALALLSLTANARVDVRHQKKAAIRASFKNEAGDCSSPQAQFDLDINNVRARLLTGGDAWWNLSEARYAVPKGDGSTGVSLNALFAGAIWITGFDAGNNLKCAAQRYRQGGDDYWPGPLTNGVIDKATCNKYDRFFNVFGADINAAQTAFLQKGSSTTLADIPRGVLAWPGKGNPYLETDPSLIGETFIIDENLAPFRDFDGDGIYDPLKGDYPVIPCRNGESEAYADQMTFWVFNDAGNQHTESNGQSIGIQVNSLAFAFQTTDDINNMTFYKYEIINKSSNPLFQTYISQWSDPDLGNFQNDRVGCDTTRSLGIVYNQSAPDVDAQGVGGYGNELPIFGIDFFEGPLSDSGQQLGLSSFVYFTNGATFAQTDPGSAAQYRNYQTGFWNDGTPFTEGGTGYGGSTPTHYIFPGNPIDPNAWSDYTSGQAAGDRRMVQTSGPFTLRPGQPQYVTVGCVFVRPAGGVGAPPNYLTTIAPADDKAQQLFDACFKLLDGPDAPTLQIRELKNELIINLVNLPGSNNEGESYDQVSGSAKQYIDTKLGGVGDSTYTFEGYVLYQVANTQVSATDLSDPEHADPTKAIPYARVDIKNGVSKIINFERDPVLNLFVPVLKIDGPDAGIQSSFRITQDLFATGTDNRLINHKTYYYTAIAYAHNNYAQYEQTNPDGDAQLSPYLQGRGNFKIYSAIPHIPDPRNEGTVLNSEWGDGVEVKRIEGQGNGGNILDLTSETIAKIMSSGSYAFSDTLTYAKKFDPIGFKVIDPVALKEADFELKFVDASNTSTVSPSSTWFLHDVTNNDTIWSDRDLERPYEQAITLLKGSQRINYGFSIKLGTPAPVYSLPAGYAVVGSSDRDIYPPTEGSSITYANPTEQWLSFLQDQGTSTTSNWIRSGTNIFDPASNSTDAKASALVFDDNWYYTGGTVPNFDNQADLHFSDSSEYFENILKGTWAPYCLTANYANKNPSSSSGSPPYVYGPGFKWRNYGQSQPPQNNLDKLASVDIIITPDKSKWSRCVVFETGEDEGVNEGVNFAPNGKASRKGQIRMHHSWDKDNCWYMDGTHFGQAPDTGRSWFPGYAINVETGERLNIAFGESSDQGDQNGRDMLWNPTTEVYSPLTLPGQLIDRLPYFGGKHFIYVMDSKYDEGLSAQRLLLDNYDGIGTAATNFRIPTALAPLYYSLMWTSIPYLSAGYQFEESCGFNNIPPDSLYIRLRVEKPYKSLTTTSSSSTDSLPRYQFSTIGMGPTEKNHDVAESACDIIRAVPNPYLGYSAYETDQNSNIIKITNLPNKCEVTIYALDGTFIRRLTRAIDIDPSTNTKIEISDGDPIDQLNIDNSIEWDMKNDKGIPIASGIYLIHINAPGICEKTIKWFGAVRPADTSNF